MSALPEHTHLLVVPHIRVQNANAISSQLTHGFPSMTAFLGLMWALDRHAGKAGLEHLAFTSVGVVCHDWQELTSGGYIKAFRLTRNPVDKDGSTAAIVEEGRIHLDVSLVFAVYADGWDESRQLADAQTLADLLAGMRVAGGTVVPHPQGSNARTRPWVADMRGAGWADAFRTLRNRLLPGSALVERADLIDQRLAQLRTGNPEASRLDAWLSLSRVDWRYEADAEDGKGRWTPSRRRGDGWLVPIPVGYGALSDVQPPGSVRNARDSHTPFRFVESLYSIGEWLGAHRLQRPEDLLWWAESAPDAGLYRCRNDYRAPTAAASLS